MRKRVVFLGLALAWTAGAPSVLAAQKIKEVAVNLGGAQLAEVLPFDVPFILKGPAGADLISITVVLRDVTQTRKLEKKTCENTLKTETADSIRRCLSARLDALRNHPKGWDSLPTARWTGTGDTFFLSMQAVEARRHFWLRFTTRRRLGEARLKEFRAAAATLLGRLLASKELASADTTALRKFREATCAALESVRQADEHVTQRTLCGAGWTPTEEVRQTFVLLTKGVLEPQAQVAGLLESIPSRIDSARALLARIRGAEYSRLVDSLWVDAKAGPLLRPGAFAGELMKQTSSRAAWCGTSPSRGPEDASLWPTRIAECEKAAEAMDAMRAALRNILLGVGVPRDLVAKIAAKLTLPAAPGALRAAIADNGDWDLLGVSLGQIAEQLTLVGDTDSRRAAGLVAAVAALVLYAEQHVTLDATTVGEYSTFKVLHISADAGLLYILGVDAVTEYVATNVYFRPVNRDAPFGSIDSDFDRRISFMVGATNMSMDDNATRKNLLGSAGLLTGLGVRLTEIIRVSLGAVLFKARSLDPLRDTYQVKANPFFALSLDIDVAGVPGTVGNWFKPK